MTESRYARLRNKVAPLGMTGIPNSKLSGMTNVLNSKLRGVTRIISQKIFCHKNFTKKYDAICITGKKALTKIAFLYKMK